jgi:hypothetical protein
MPSKTSAYIRQYGFVELVMVVAPTLTSIEKTS